MGAALRASKSEVRMPERLSGRRHTAILLVQKRHPVPLAQRESSLRYTSKNVFSMPTRSRSLSAVFNETEKKLLRDTWRLVTPIGDTAAELFYKRLFELRPVYRDLFPTDMDGQKRKLIATLAFAVKTVDWPLEDWQAEVDRDNDLLLVVLALGRRHRLLYRVPEDAFPVVGESLIWTLDMGLGQAFTPAAKAAWVKLYGMLSAIMLMGFKAPAEAGQTA